MEPFLGVAVHGFPNYFFITGPDIAAQARYVVECLGLLKRSAGTRIEVRRSSQQVFNERVYLKPAQPHPVTSAFDLSSASDSQRDLRRRGDADDRRHGTPGAGPAHRAHRPDRRPLPLAGDGFCLPGQPLPDDALKQARAATLTVGERSAPARIVEQTPWGTHAVAGVGAPPYLAPTAP